MLTIERTGNDSKKTYGKYKTRAEAVEAIRKLAMNQCEEIPNNPTVDQCGPDSLAVSIGVHKIYTFTIVSCTK